MILISLFLSTIGSGTVLCLLLWPPDLVTEADGKVACVSALGSNSVYDENDDGITSEWWAREEDTCERLRRARIATAILVAVPTTIAGAVGVTALVFRRRLAAPEAERSAEE
ncbi:hypothetical protein KIK06_28555 [Nocardiopsis sp. EMB25]|uniref:hypothetical protein n=1 Tax=Nocardiopsis sp. EMB25 TaxID=2835867 RepID=UPI0022839807|nr:hypothetical protein [Nocardiopsis sp. EMB25]MCY9787834.1 hypothetical protein [Nocardiopsis sp. EMB25]